MKWSQFMTKNHHAKKTMPTLIRFLKSKTSGFVFSAVCQCMAPVRYGKGMLWRLVRNRHSNYSFAVKNLSHSSLTDHLPSILHFWSKLMCVGLFCESHEWHCCVWCALLGLPHPLTVSVQVEGRCQAAQASPVAPIC